MQVVCAPATLHQPSLFLGGSISGTEDWQKQFIKKLDNALNRVGQFETDLIVYNPRRDDFDVTNKDMEFEQIEWEFRHLRMADILVFWFAKETVGPITLFELGRHSQIRGRAIYVGADPEYPRLSDLKIQMQLIGLTNGARIRTNITELVDDVFSWVEHHETAVNHGGRKW